MIRIAIDGPAGAGKSSVARLLAKKLGIVHIDTGAMYRTLGLHMLRRGDMPFDASEVLRAMDECAIDVRLDGDEQRIYLDGEDVTGLIRTQECSAAAAAVSAIGEVRERMVDMQRKLASGRSVVMDGRDIGTVVLADTRHKFFVTALARERAVRRFKELEAKGGCEVSIDELEAQIAKRDHDDSTREHSPLKAAADALVVDTTDMTLEQVVDYISRSVLGGASQ